MGTGHLGSGASHLGMASSWPQGPFPEMPRLHVLESVTVYLSPGLSVVVSGQMCISRMCPLGRHICVFILCLCVRAHVKIWMCTNVSMKDLCT